MGPRATCVQDLEKLRLQTMTTGEVAGATGESVNFLDLAGRMTSKAGSSAGGGRSFVADGMHIEDLQGLVAQKAVPQTKPQQDEEKAEGKPQDVGHQQPTPPDADDKWFDRDKAVSAAKRKMTLSFLELKSQISKQIADCKQGIFDAKNRPGSALIENELAVATKSLTGLEALLSDSPEALPNYIRSFDNPSGAEGTRAIGSAPPCRNYQSLVPLASISSQINKFDAIAGKSDIEKLKKEITAQRVPITSLLAAAKSGLAELKTAQEEHSGKKKSPKKPADADATSIQQNMATKKAQTIYPRPL